MNLALVHEWLTTFAGSEKVIEQICAVQRPQRIFTLVDFLDHQRPQFLNGIPVTTSFVQRLPRARKSYRGYLPVLPLAVEQFDVTGHDVVISSHHCVAHGVLTRPDQPHLVYTHSPVRYAWDLQHQYLEESGLARKRLKGGLARVILHYLRIWDRLAGARPDFYAANSKFIAQRIWRCYRRRAEVIHPPVNIDAFTPGGQRSDYYLTASRLVPYKKIRLIVQTFAQLPHRKLVVIGDGPDLDTLRREATPNVEFLGYQGGGVLLTHLRQARAFLFAALEDFGILPVEAQACGTPVIAFGQGGTAETVLDGKTGVLFPAQTVPSVKTAIERFESLSSTFREDHIRAHAEGFSEARFRAEFSSFIDRCLTKFRTGEGE